VNARSAGRDKGFRPAAMGADLAKLLRVKPGSKVKLGGIDPADTHGHVPEDAAATLLASHDRLESLQERLWAGKGGSLLIVLQGIDTAGKDGTIRHVMTAFNPQGCSVIGFGVPNDEELAHDYLWRIHRHTPGRGTISIFNRSHYEDVLVVRVHDLVRPKVWRKRYDQINAFEAHLAANGTTILKFFLWISPEEQRERLQARVDTPDKRWKFKRGDIEERKHWDDYQRAFEAALSRCSTDVAPWYVIPSDRKWFRNLAVAEILTESMDHMGLTYPPPEADIDSIVVE
jgi:PPK2 family polyphosphate:nucleotide phosphotransferase